MQNSRSTRQRAALRESRMAQVVLVCLLGTIVGIAVSYLLIKLGL